MAGLLNPESGAALARLGAGLLAGNFAGGLASASEYAAGLPEQKLKRGLLEAQIAETQGQAQERAAKLEALRRQQEIDRQFFGLGGGAATPVTSVAGGPPAPSASAPTGGAPAAPGGGFTAHQISAQFGVPLEAVIADYKFNGGKKIAELIEARSKPNWQNINGNLVNTNAPGFQGGFQPGMSVSSNGQVTAWQPNGQGGVTVGAPQGAFDTFRQYQNIQEGTKALLGSAGRVNLRQNADGTQTPVSELSENPVLQQVLGVQVPGQPPTQAPPQGSPQRHVVSPEAQRSADQEAVRMMQAELQNPNLPPDQRAGIQREIARLQQAGAQPGFPAASSIRNPQGYGMTNEQQAAAAAAKTKAEADARAQSEAEAGRNKKATTAKDMLGMISQARSLLEQGPTSSGVGSVVDSALGLVGQSTKGADVAAQLEAISGWMVNNVPRMEGPQSNFDVQNYRTMAGIVGDRTKPISTRMAALQTVETLQRKYAHLNGGEAAQSEGGASGGWGGGNVLNELPKSAPKGQKVRDTATGKVLQFNGLSWVEVK
jgi:hypothetical protein